MLKQPRIKKKRSEDNIKYKKTMVGARRIVRRLIKAIRNREKEKKSSETGNANIILKNATIMGNLKNGEKEITKTSGKKYKGLDLAEIDSLNKFTVLPENKLSKDLEQFRVSYPLIPIVPKPHEKVYAYARIEWDPHEKAVVYNVIEPPISALDKKIIEEVKRELEERLDVNFVKIGEVKAKNLLKSEIRSILSDIKKLPPAKIDALEYYIQRDIIGYGKIEPLMQDPSIEDISCDGVNSPIYVYHRNPKLGSMKTNIKFYDKEELDMFVMKLAQKAGRSVSVSEPLVNGALPDGSRVQATLGTDIAMKGSNFTIRKFTTLPLTPIHMMDKGTLDSTMLAYLWLAIENRKSILISGGTATGKTSLLNALSLFIKPSLKVVSIEDTPELRLSHPHWIPEVARTPITVEGGRKSDVTLFDLLKESLRQRPDYIIVGEVRGKEAYVLFQQIATGHAGLATIHAASLPQLIDRLVTPPISLPATLIENIDIVIFLTQVKVGENFSRKVKEIIEITGIEGEKPVHATIFEWDPSNDAFVLKEKSKVMYDIAQILAMDEDEIIEELARRKTVLEWIFGQGIYDYRTFANIINQYYTTPEKLMFTIDRSL